MKILMVGGTSVGKTSIARRFAGLPFSVEYFPSKGQKMWELPPRRLPGHDKVVRPVLWDVAASEMGMLKRKGRGGGGDNMMLSSLLKGTAVVMFVFDLGSTPSLHLVDMWHSMLEPYLEPWVVKALIGHKADTEEFVVDQSALDEYVVAAGFRLWCCTVGSGEFGDYNIGIRKAKRKGKWTRTGDNAMGSQKTILARQLSVWELLDKVLHSALVAKDEARVQSQKLLRLRANVAEIMPQFDKGSLLGEALYRPACRKALASRIELPKKLQSNDIWNSFSGSLTHETAEAILTKRTDGSFLLHRGNGSDLVLSISGCGHSVHHVTIRSVEGGYTDQEGKYGPFDTLDEFWSSDAGDLAKYPLRAPRETHVEEEGMLNETAKVIKKDVRGIASAIDHPNALSHESTMSRSWRPRGSISLDGNTPGDNTLQSVGAPFHSTSTLVSKVQANRVMTVAARVESFTSSCLASLQDMGNTDTISQLILLLSCEKGRLLSMVKDVESRPGVVVTAIDSGVGQQNQHPLLLLDDQNPQDSCVFPAVSNPNFRPVVAAENQQNPFPVRAEEWFHLLEGVDNADTKLNHSLNKKQMYIKSSSNNLQWPTSVNVDEILTELENLVELSTSRWNSAVNCLAVSMSLTEGMNCASVAHSQLPT